MLIHWSVMLLFVKCVATYNDNRLVSEGLINLDKFSSWPSVHNGAAMMRLRKRESQDLPPGLSEGGLVAPGPTPDAVSPQAAVPKKKVENTPTLEHEGLKDSKLSVPEQNPKKNATIEESNHVKSQFEKTVTQATPNVLTASDTTANTTVPKVEPEQLDINKPGVLKRGVIVFSAFALMAGAYFAFYRCKKKRDDFTSMSNSSDANQFRYGVLQSEDRSNHELDRLPLTMDSDDDDEEDLEIFDLEQKKKSMSYVNLEVSDYDLVIPPGNSREDLRDNLLLDIENQSSSSLINLNQSNRSIL